MEQRVVVGVDGPDPGRLAADRAVDEAARHGFAPHVVHATRRERYERFASAGPGRPSARATAESVVAAAGRRPGGVSPVAGSPPAADGGRGQARASLPGRREGDG